MTTQQWESLAWFAIALNLVGYLWQIITIRRLKSAEAVSRLWFITSITVEAVNVIFGRAQDKPVFVYNGVLCAIGQLLVLRSMQKRKEWMKLETAITIASGVIIAVAILTPFKAFVQVVATGLNIFGGKDQPDQLKKSRGTGALELGSLSLSWLSGLIWFGYCRHYFGLFSPAIGLAGFVLYQSYLILLWLRKHFSADASS